MHGGLERAADRFGDRPALRAGEDDWSFRDLDGVDQRVRPPPRRP